MVQESTISLSALTDRVAGIQFAARESDRDVVIRDIRIDSREVRPETLFVALPGSQADGHDFLVDAVEAGASAVLVQRDRVSAAVGSPANGDAVSGDVPVLIAEDTRRVLGPLASAFFGQPADDLTVVGITGTNGKTTTAHLVAGILKERWKVGTVGTIGAEWGTERTELPNTTPESLHLQRLFHQMRSDGVECVVLEVSSHGLSTHRMRGTSVDVGVFTNLSQDHLDFHGDLESYREAKARLFSEFMRERRESGDTATGIFNLNDETGRRFAERFSGRDWRVVTYAVDSGDANPQGDPDYVARPRALDLEGSDFDLRFGQKTAQLRTRLLGEFNVSNATAGAVVGRELGLGPEEIRRGLERTTSVPGRMERVRTKELDASRVPAVFVDYAHTPDALERAIRTLRPLTEGRLIAVFGCGGDRDTGKRAPMGRVAAESADLVFVTSDNPRSEAPSEIIADILAGLPDQHLTGDGTFPDSTRPVSVVSDREEAMRVAIKGAGPEDVILIAGKGHEGYQEVDGERRTFDDVEVAASLLEERYDQTAVVSEDDHG